MQYRSSKTKKTLFFPGSSLAIMVIQENFTYASCCTAFNKLKCMRMSQYRNTVNIGYDSEYSIKIETNFSVKSNSS